MDVKSKIFFGTKINSADDQFNKWISEHPSISIVEFKYQHTSTYWHHSICILYKEQKYNYEPHSGVVCREEYFLDNFID